MRSSMRESRKDHKRGKRERNKTEGGTGGKRGHPEDGHQGCEKLSGKKDRGAARFIDPRAIHYPKKTSKKGRSHRVIDAEIEGEKADAPRSLNRKGKRIAGRVATRGSIRLGEETEDSSGTEEKGPDSSARLLQNVAFEGKDSLSEGAGIEGTRPTSREKERVGQGAKLFFPGFSKRKSLSKAGEPGEQRDHENFPGKNC